MSVPNTPYVHKIQLVASPGNRHLATPLLIVSRASLAARWIFHLRSIYHFQSITNHGDAIDWSGTYSCTELSTDLARQYLDNDLQFH